MGNWRAPALLVAALLIPACGGGGGGGGPPPAPPPPPVFAPSALAVTDASNDQIDLAWTDANPDESGFLVERAPDSGGAPGAWTAAGTMGADVTVFSDTGRPALTTWWYRVSAFNAGGSTAPSVPVSGTTTNTPAWMGLGGSSWGVGHGTRIRTGSGTGGGVSNTGMANGVSLALDSTGKPVLAWPDQGTLFPQIYLKRWDGSQWSGLAGSDSGNGMSAVSGMSSVQPSLKLDASDQPVVAWSAGGEIYLKRWNGSSWVELGGSATAGGISATGSSVSTQPALALDGSANPVIAWQEQLSGAHEIYVRRWNGSAWVELGGSGTGGGISGTATDSQDPSLGLDASGNPRVAWTEQTGPGTTAIYVKSWNGSAWVELAGSASGAGMSNTAGRAAVPSLAVDASGRPVVAYSHVLAGATDVFLRAWDGSQWAEIGGSATGGGISGNLTATPGPYWPGLALGASGYPVVSWVHWFGGHPNVYLRLWDGAQWTGLGGSDSGSGVSNAFHGVYEPVVALDSAGNPTLGWYGDDPSIRQVYLRRWDGSQWSELGTTSPSAGGVSRSPRRSEEPSLAMDASGWPVVAWQDSSTGNYEIYLRRWDGTQWAELGGSATGGGVSGTPGASRYLSMALDPAGHPVIAWEEAVPGWTYVYVKRWNGSQWVELGGSASGYGISGIVAAFGSPSVAVDPSGNPMVTWCEEISGIRQVYVKKWNGSVWAELGGSATGGGVSAGAVSSDYPVLASDSAGNPVVAWNYYSTNAEIYLKAWDGLTWVEIGGSASGGGASSTSGTSRYADLVIDASDRPVLAWQEYVTTNEELYLKRWNGSAWVALGGSATGGGISASPGHSTGPSLALDGAGNPIVAWDDRTPGNREVHLRRWNGASWVEFLASSATAGGVSNSDGSAYTVSLSSAGGATGVAWVGWGLTACEVYFRRAAGP